VRFSDADRSITLLLTNVEVDASLAPREIVKARLDDARYPRLDIRSLCIRARVISLPAHRRNAFSRNALFNRRNADICAAGDTEEILESCSVH